MTIKECYEDAVRNEYVDLYTLILFLVLEKKILTFDDPADKLSFYYQDKFRTKMNDYLIQYKKKNSIKYHPCVYELNVNEKRYKTIYIVARDQQQATSYALSLRFKPVGVTTCDIELVMAKYITKNEKVHLTIKQLRDRQSQIPSFLGGF